DLIFDTSKTKFDKELLIKQFRDYGLNFHIFQENTLFLTGNKINISFGCSLYIDESEDSKREGRYIGVNLSDKLSKESLIFILQKLIALSGKMNYKIICNGYVIDESNFESFVGSKFKTCALKQDSLKRHYLGSVKPNKSPSKKNIDILQLTTLDNSDSVVNVLCTFCNKILEVNSKGAESLCKHAKIPFTGDFNGKYFTTSSCIFCQADNGEIKVYLKNVSELAN
ncbi:MAG TPA: hypothetical protein VIK14_16235, partial [Ignavibacteria bacterium]